MVYGDEITAVVLALERIEAVPVVWQMSRYEQLRRHLVAVGIPAQRGVPETRPLSRIDQPPVHDNVEPLTAEIGQHVVIRLTRCQAAVDGESSRDAKDRFDRVIENFGLGADRGRVEW